MNEGKIELKCTHIPKQSFSSTLLLYVLSMQRVAVVQWVINVGATFLAALAIIPIAGQMNWIPACQQMNYVQQEDAQSFPLITL